MNEISVAQVDEAELAVRIMYQEREAFRVFEEVYGRKVLGWLIKRHGRDVAEDAYYQALQKVWERIEGYTPEKGSLGCWFLRIAQNTAIDILRGEKEYREQVRRFDPDYDPADPVTERSGQACGEDQRSRDLLLRDFHEVLKALPRLQREVIWADLAEGKSVDAKSAAKRLESSAAAIPVHRSKAKEAIRQQMLARGHYKQ